MTTTMQQTRLLHFCNNIIVEVRNRVACWLLFFNTTKIIDPQQNNIDRFKHRK